MSLSARGHGEFWTVPFVLESDSISLNLKSGNAGSVRIGIERVLGDYDDVRSIRSEPIEEFTVGDCGTVTGDHIDVGPAWAGGDLSTPRGKTVRLQVRKYKTDLYAIRFGRDDQRED